MVASTALARDSRFKLGWIMLLGLSALLVLMHGMLVFVEVDEIPLFITLTLFNVLSLIVLWIPFRRGEKWAWYATWLLPIGLALPAYFVALEIAISYYVMAAVCVLALLLTMRDFFVRR